MDNYFSSKKLPDGTGPYPNCPAIGIYARDLTTYVNTNEVVGMIKYTEKIKNYSDFNKYIQSNGKKISDGIFEYHKANSCFPNVCTDNFPTNISIQQMKEQREVTDNKWNKKYTKNKGCSNTRDYRIYDQ